MDYSCVSSSEKKQFNMKTRGSVKLKESTKNAKQESLRNHHQSHYSLSFPVQYATQIVQSLYFLNRKL